MLIDRLKTSAVLIVLIGALVYLDAKHSFSGGEGLWLLPVLLFFALGTAWDLSGLVKASGRSISRSTTLAATATVTISAGVPLFWSVSGRTSVGNVVIGNLGWIVIGAIVAVMIAIGREMAVFHGADLTKNSDQDSQEDRSPNSDQESAQKKHQNGSAIDRTSSAVFVSLYVGLPMAMLVSLRGMGSGNWGLLALLTTIAVTKSSDAGAYFVGRAIGRHKLIPRLSPGKTIEGALGGVLTSTIVAFVFLAWIFPSFMAATAPADAAAMGVPPFWRALVLGPMLAVSGMLGDLAESLVKRDAAAKDSGNWLPGLGGVWDVTDSLIAAVMPAYLCFAFGVAGPMM
ncbi:Phosphatidate cytidylyltransferase [Planctomycetes bacterium CA13]|uniref:Phosphatidate cytidylyltransferase n=1 Tax=Novipirellula herctigrandis TaxID=2527986 RepID=A0A5C5ZAU5_9BACT|nr:Phosphatidate cytidylyltransferase [Planctomycetes bacterium CA13]